MEYFIVYLLVTLGSFDFLVIVLPVLAILVGGAIWAGCHDEDYKQHIASGAVEARIPGYKIFATKLIKFVLVPCFLFSLFIPSKTDLMWIVGLGTGWKVIQNEQVQALPPKLVEFLNKQLEEQVK